MEKSDFEKRVEKSTFIPEDVKAFIKERNNKVLNAEELSIGDSFVILGIKKQPTKGVIDGVEREWIEVNTKGDRSSVSIARLVGTPKRFRYFSAERVASGQTILADDYDESKVVELGYHEGDALLALEQYQGKKLRVCAIANECGRDNDRTYYLFDVVE